MPVLTGGPDLHLLVDGSKPRPARCTGKTYRFTLLGCPRDVRIVSRAGVLSELGLARDSRSLGVALRRIVLRSEAETRICEADDVRLQEGVHPSEPIERIRWTDGDAGLTSELFAGCHGPLALVLHLGGATQYPLIATEEASQAA